LRLSSAQALRLRSGQASNSLRTGFDILSMSKDQDVEGSARTGSLSSHFRVTTLADRPTALPFVPVFDVPSGEAPPMSLRCDILLADGMKKAPWVAPWVDNRLRAVIERWGF
jgi:hypothetical protein